jgi:protocatechuate 3,4-dioxygenase beta subunit
MGLRSDRRRERREEASREILDPAPSPEALVARAEAQRAVVDAVLSLDEPYRSTVLLRYFEELTSVEIARRLAIPEGTVRRRLKEAIDRLRSSLGTDRAERTRMLAPLLIPLARSRPIPISVGVIAMKKLVAVMIVIAIAISVTVWWRHAHSPTSPLPGTVATNSDPAREYGASGSASPVGWFAPQDTRDRTIAGRVVFGDRPIANAIVALHEPYSRSRGKPAREVRTDASGRFDFGAFPPAGVGYEVTATAPTYSPAIVWARLADPTAKPPSDQLVLRLGSCDHGVYGTVFDASGNGIRGAHVTRDGVVGVDADEHGAYRLCSPRGRGDVTYASEGYGGVSLSVDVEGDTRQDVVLVPEATISGRVTALSDGHPVSDALIQASPWHGGTDRPTGTSTVSDSDGRFHIAGLVPDRYGVVAVTLAAKSERMPVTARVSGGAEVELRVVSLGRITGRVVSHGRPVAGANLVATRVSPNAHSDAGTSQADGTFVLEHVPLGDVVISAAPYRVVSPTTLHVRDMSNPVDVIVDVERLAMVHGRVTRDGSPVVNASVCCVPQIDGATRAFTDGDGLYEFRGVRAGTHHVVAWSEDVGAGSPEAAITIGDGEERQVDFDLSLAATISGTVVDQEGQPVVGALVKWTNEVTGDIGKGTTDRTGHYRCTAMTGGAKYRAAVYPQPSLPAYPVANDGSYPELEVRDGAANLEAEPIAIEVHSLAVSGHVVDEMGEPIADALVRALATPASSSASVSGAAVFSSWLKLPSTFTDGDGAFTLSGLAAGAYVVGAHAAGGGDGAALNVAAGADSVAIRIARPGAIVGSLSGFAAVPLAYASDVAHADNWAPADRVDSSSFRISGLRPGRYVVSASTDHDSDAQLVDVQNGQTTDVALRARGHAAVDVTVLDFKTHAPIAGAACHVQSSAGGIAGQANWSSASVTPTDASGHVTLDDVPAGPGLVLCNMPTITMSMPSADVTLTPGSRGNAQLFTVTIASTYPVTIGVGFDWRSAPPRLASVAAGGPGAQAGLQVGDLVTAVDGMSVSGLNGAGVSALIGEHVAATPFEITVMRAGTSLVLSVTGQPFAYQ